MSEARARKSDNLSVDEMAARLLNYWHNAKEWMREAGASWYLSAQEWAEGQARETGVSVVLVAGVIAAYSPQTRWIDNLIDADNHIRGKALRTGVMGSNVKRATNVMAMGLPGLGKGPKTAAFARNILGDTDAVTVDVWAARAAFGTMDKQLASQMLGWVGAYDMVADAYRKAAAEAGVSASTMQAAVWIAIRGKAD